MTIDLKDWRFETSIKIDKIKELILANRPNYTDWRIEASIKIHRIKEYMR